MGTGRRGASVDGEEYHEGKDHLYHLLDDNQIERQGDCMYFCNSKHRKYVAKRAFKHSLLRISLIGEHQGEMFQVNNVTLSNHFCCSNIFRALLQDRGMAA